MSTDDENDGTRDSGPAGSGADSGHASAQSDGSAQSDPLRDLMLGVAAQIDQLAAWFGGSGTAATGGGGGLFVADIFAGDVAGEISSLVREISDLLARLIAALIAVLEAIAAALRTAPATQAAPAARYQPIAVRIDERGSAGSTGSAGSGSGSGRGGGPQRQANRLEPEGES